MVPVLPVYNEELDNVGQLLAEPLVVPGLDQVVIVPGQVERLGRSGEAEVDLWCTGGAVSLQVAKRAPVECLDRTDWSSQGPR